MISVLHNIKPDNLKIFLDNSIDIEILDYNILNKYSIPKFNQYATANTKSYSLYNSNKVYFKKFEKKYLTKFYDST